MEEGGAGAEISGAVDGTDPNIRGDEDEIMSEEILVCSLFIFFPNIVFQNLVAVYKINLMTQWFYILHWVVYFIVFTNYRMTRQQFQMTFIIIWMNMYPDLPSLKTLGYLPIF